MRTFARVVAAIAGAFYLGSGLWAFFAPVSFAQTVARFPPYNEHYLHDIGAFCAGLGVVLLAALVWSQAMEVALAGAIAASVLHEVSHVLDLGEGGRPSDPWSLGLLVLLCAAALAAWMGRNGVRT